MRKTYTNDIVTSLVGIVFVCGWITLCIALVLLKVWIIGSLATSTLKTLKNDCGKRYGVESVLSGDWFCPTQDNHSEETADRPINICGAY